MGRHRWGLEAVVAFFFVVVLVAVGGVALNVFLNISPPVHSDPASVPSTAAAAPATRYSDAVEQSKRLARALVVENDVPALSAAVAVDGEIVWAEGFGYANVERHTPVTPHTRFRIGSVSKTLTSAAVALLYERGKIDLDAAVQTYVPAYPKKPWTLTTRQLLGDVGGVHRIRGDNSDNVPRGHCTSLKQAVASFAGEPLLFEPGSTYRFSTYGWILLSAVIEGAAGQPFATFMSHEIFEPLGMERTELEGTTPTDTDIVSFYATQRAFGINQGVGDAAEESYSCFFGAGGFLSTPSDLVRLGSAMMVRLKPDTTKTTPDTTTTTPNTTQTTTDRAATTRRLVKAETLTLFQTPLTLSSGDSTGFALGWKVDEVQLAGVPMRVVRHRASLVGGAASLSIFPEPGLVVAVTTNKPGIDNVDAFVLHVAEEFAREAR